MVKRNDLLDQQTANVKNNIMKIVKCLILSVLISSCCTTRVCKVERAEKKIYNLTQKFPELLQKGDTIVLQDTIKLDPVLADTSFVDSPSDTIIVIKDKIKIQYIRQDSIIYLSGECEGDTIYITNEVPVEKVVIRKPTFAERAKDWTWFLFAVAALLLVARIFFKDFFKIFNIFK